MSDSGQQNINFEQPQMSSEQKKNYSATVVSALGMVAALIIILIGLFAIWDRNFNFETVRAARFGADFYTAIHAATAAAAHNVRDLVVAISYIPIALGVFMFFYFLLQLVKHPKT